MGVILGAAPCASAFSLLGPEPDWQTFRLGYQVGGLDIGGTMNLTEEYRLNIKTISYGFDKTFIDYFGKRGVEEVNKAMAIMNALPPVSKMSRNLLEFPNDTRRYNSRAAALNILDLKSATMANLLEQMGLASPERFVWSLRSRVPVPGAPAGVNWYAVIMRNFDPVTWEPSRYINGTLYTYTIIDAYWAADSSEAVEIPVDPLAPTYTAVASYFYSSAVSVNLYGMFYTGLTRDDVGGLRYILRPNNYNYENLLPGTLPGTAAWTPVGGTNNQNTNLLVNLALRPGVDKIVFKRVGNESGVGWVKVVTNRYTDTYILNGRKRSQKTQRVLAGSINGGVTNGLPDLLFAAGDIGVGASGYPAILERLTVLWENNSALNSQSGNLQAGPGVIQPPAVITFNNVGPFNFHQSPAFADEANVLEVGYVWGAFDGTTNPPVIFPERESVEALENRVLRGNN
ncbi:MAG TPA: hypothetical protein VEH04_19815 [Verrucomicrobiae bacterium]|nr:hypothetical protein [Verrucomicrobiae bacterium]